MLEDPNFLSFTSNDAFFKNASAKIVAIKFRNLFINKLTG
jgi:hypothetical protein